MTQFTWLIEAPGPRYLAVRALPSTYYEFIWKQDASDALRFWSKDHANSTMMALRRMQPDLFAFEKNLGDAAAVEHGFMDNAA